MMDEQYKCPICKDMEYVLVWEKGKEYARPCECKKIRRAEDRLNQSGISKSFYEKSFDNFDTSDNKVLEDAKAVVMRYTKNYMNAKDRLPNSLLISGQSGSGKTHLGTACCRALMEQGVPVVYMKYREVIGKLKQSIRDETQYEKSMDRYKTAALLYIDDLLKGRYTESDLNILYEIVDYRYSNMLPMIISTERSLNELNSFDQGTAGRIIQMSRGNIILLQGEELNYRLYG